MAKVLHRANSNLSDEAILSMYEDGLSRMGKAQGECKIYLNGNTFLQK